MPALCMRASTVLKGKPKASHISLIVKPSMTYMSALYATTLITTGNFLHNTKQMFSVCKKILENIQEKSSTYLTKCRNYPMLYLR
jgi:hypothetical protein